MAPAIRLAPLRGERDLARVIALEAASYPADEAASPDKIRFRQQHAGAFFQVATLASDAADADDEPAVAGFVNGTLAAGDELTDASMSRHDPLGTTLCIHSVVVDGLRRRQGIASAMLTAYVRDVVETQPQVRRIALLAKAGLVGFYVRCGFAVSRLSPVVHGQDPWFELVLDAEAARRLAVVQVDAFSREIFDGNPAAVVLMPPALFKKDGVAAWMQSVAKENNLSETAYIARRAPRADDDGRHDVAQYDLRWFTPGTEVALCGHATLSSAFVLYQDGHVPLASKIHFHTLSGVLVCNLEQKDGTNWIAMDFPLRELVAPAPDLALGVLAKGLNVAEDDFIAVKQTQTTDVLVHIPTDKFASVSPNFDLLAQVEARGIVVTAEKEPNDHGVDFQSRFFGPRVGVPEDPVTGSAHCALARYWSGVLKKCTLYAHQACPLRGGYLNLELPADRPDRVLIKGEAVVSLRGTLLTSP